MKEINPEYLFKWKPEKKTLFFITQSAHASGKALKNLQEVAPSVLEKVQSMCADIKPDIGEVIILPMYVFIVSRKHYASKHDLDLVRQGLDKLKEHSIKMSSEDFPSIVEIARNYPNIEIKSISNWEHSIL